MDDGIKKDDNKHLEQLKRRSRPLRAASASLGEDVEQRDSEASCGAFGYLRGIRDQCASVELRFRDGNSIWFPYSWLGTCQYDPSSGLLLRFSGDLVYLVLIKGSNINQPLNEGSINLTHAGLQKHRVLWVREMSDEEIFRVGEKGPTIDSIEVAEFETNAKLLEWLGKYAPEFSR